ncbi:MAG: protein kinase domain-containing protein [Thermoanaerobaculia bacterium]
MTMIGERIGRIRITETLGAGGMGEVYGGLDETLGRRVAVKVIHARHRLNAQARIRLTREAQVLSQLDHPNICRIFDYIEGDEADYLVLERIDGLVLRDVVAKKILPFSDKLRIAEAIAAVLVEAHRRGIIHRDLKPENVMMTKAGEVKVLDFGLARFLDASPEPAARAVSPGPGGETDVPGDADDTAILPAGEPHDVTEEVGVARAVASRWGAAAGTPRYMSPEQARGEPLTPSSDMYSFGLLLQFLFTGKDAYGDSWDMQAIMLLATQGMTGTITGVDSDVEALISGLEQPAPTDRPTASAALARLRWIADRPRRRAKRLVAVAALVVALAAGGKYTWDLRRERAAADDARLEAQRRRGDAEELVGFMLGDLRKKLEPLGRLDILDEAGTKVLGYYENLDSDRLTPGELASNAKALTQLGEVRIAQGKLPEAVAAFEKSLELAEKALARDGADAALRLGVGTSHFWVGNASRMQGDLGKALEHFQKYLAIAEELCKREPGNEEYELERAYGHGNVGVVLEAQGRFDQALEHYRVSREIKERKLARDPKKPALRADFATSTNKVGAVMLALGRVTAAREEFEREVAARKSLAAEDPKHMRRQDLLATALDFLAKAQIGEGDLDAALESLESELAIRKALVDVDPSNVQWIHHIGIAHMQLANLRSLRGEVAPSIESYRESERHLSAALAKEPNRPLWKREQARGSVGHARALLLRGDARGALARVDGAIAELGEAGQSEPAATLALAEARLARGDTLAALGREADAAVEWRGADEILAPLVVPFPDARAFDCRARTLLRLGRVDEAREIVNTLSKAGYKHPELQAACRAKGC